jgi:hypothetical protein
MRDNHANRMPMAISPNSLADVSVSTVAAQKIVAASCVAIQSVATKIKANKEKAKKIDECQTNGRNHHELGSPRYPPSRTSGFKKLSHLEITQRSKVEPRRE